MASEGRSDRNDKRVTIALAGIKSSRHASQGLIVNLGDPRSTPIGEIGAENALMIAPGKSDDPVVPLKRVMTVEGRGSQERKDAKQ